MQSTREWLDALELGEFAEAFEVERIQLRQIPKLAEADLKELGLPMGPRKAILEAAQQLAKGNTLREEASKSTPSEPQREAERRQITVMFCDLVGSTALSKKLDPEELRDVMQAYRKACTDVIARYDGHVAQYLGDGVMVYFGWPMAHEDDAGRAVRAGLDIITAVSALEAEASLAVRVGIATGLVVVGESGADEGADAKLAVGETPNVAARIQALAEAGSVAIAQSTRRLLGGEFALDDLGTHDAKGVSGGLRVHRVMGATETEGRFEARAEGGLTPFVGRETELATLLERWQQAKDGEGQVVLICGEPGIGKSRITESLHQRLTNDSLTRLRLQCSPYHTNSAFYPLIRQFERGAGLESSDDTDTKLKKLEAFVALAGVEAPKVVPLFAAMLSLPLGGYPPLNMSPEKQKALTIEAFGAQLAGLAARSPVLFVFEDAHWADPTTLGVLNELVDRAESARVLLLITYRPNFQPTWVGPTHITTLNLHRLSRRRGAEMVAKVTGGKPLPAEVLDEILAKTGGIPLFVEELTKAVLEGSLLEEREEAYTLSGPLPPLAIPTTLQDSLMARLDSLSTVRGVAQIGACIGREFSYELLAAVSPMGGNELQEALVVLTNSELVYSRGAVPNALYVFKHALVQDAAHSSLLKGRRQEIHAQIAQSLNQISPETVANKPELLAHHYTQAGLADQAISFRLKAARNAAARLAYAEAKANLDLASELLEEIPVGEARDKYEIVVCIERGELMRRSIGYASPESGDAFKRAEEILERQPNLRQRFRVNLALGVYHAIRADFSETHRYLSRTF